MSNKNHACVLITATWENAEWYITNGQKEVKVSELDQRDAEFYLTLFRESINIPSNLMDALNDKVNPSQGTALDKMNLNDVRECIRLMIGTTSPEGQTQLKLICRRYMKLRFLGEIDVPGEGYSMNWEGSSVWYTIDRTTGLIVIMVGSSKTSPSRELHYIAPGDRYQKDIPQLVIDHLKANVNSPVTQFHLRTSSEKIVAMLYRDGLL